jgi:superfamily II DNA or RNA helicase
MSTENLNTYIENLVCFPHQAEFAAKFLAADSERKHLLTSLPGLGKGFVGSAIVGYSATHGQARQILVLAPTALAHQWVEMIRRANPNVPCEFVDRRRLRELESRQSIADSVWVQISVVVMSIDFAKRPDVTEVITHTSWDFLVVDEAHHLAPQTQRQQLVTALVEHSPEMRVLYLHPLFQNSGGEEKENPLFKDIETTVWSRETVRDKDGKPLLPEVQIEWIRHTRQPDEAALLTQLQESLKVVAGHGQQGQFIGTLLMKEASSSLFALEQQLNRMRYRRNQIAHGLEEFLNDSDDDTNLWSDDSESDPTPNFHQQTLLKFGDRITALIETLEDVSTDSKLDSLISLLDRLGLSSSSDRRVCIFTSYVATATYLESALCEHHSHVASVTGSLSYAEREQAVADFAQNGGILIATLAMSIPIPEVAAVIFYDLPMNPATLDARIGQFIRVGRSGPVHVYSFADESQTLLIELLQRKAIKIKQALGGDEAQKLLFPDDHNGERLAGG